MAVPDFQTVMLPLLRAVADGAEYRLADLVPTLAAHFNLSVEEQQQLLPSGRMTTLRNRAGWARTYLKKAGLLEQTRRGYVRISDRGRELLARQPAKITVSMLRSYPEFVAFQALTHQGEESGVAVDAAPSVVATPEEALDAAYQLLRQTLEAELLDQVRSASPAFFERLVIDLLVKMGYGGSLRDAGTAVGMSGDGGIDGVIKEDLLGLDMIYLQAKRWEYTVGRPEIQKFVGALHGQRARKGVFLTTSSFSAEAHDYASQIDSRVILVDGTMLARLMIDHNVGVSPVRSFEVKRVDSDYFLEE